MPGNRRGVFDNSVIPRPFARRGVDVLLKKAAVDPAFKKLLLEKRSVAAEAIGLELDATETTLINAALSATAACDAPVGPPATLGSQPDPPPKRRNVAEPIPPRDAQGADAPAEDGSEIDREVEL